MKGGAWGTQKTLKDPGLARGHGTYKGEKDQGNGSVWNKKGQKGNPGQYEKRDGRGKRCGGQQNVKGGGQEIRKQQF